MSKAIHRPLYEPETLRPMFAPRSVAIVGVSTRTGSFGQRAWANMSRFTGHLYPVNPRYETYLGQPCFPSISALPEVPDCVLLATPRELSEDVLRECTDRVVPAAVLFASGYAETGKPERMAEQERLVALARQSGLRLLGPNCMGLVNNAQRVGLTFGLQVPFADASAHGIGLVSQSGAIAFALAEAIQHGKAFSHVLTAGNAVDVDVADQIAYLAQDQDCKAIACVLEGIRDPLRLIEAGQRARRAGKPVVVFKLARSEEGAAAAVSHTGTLAGSDAAYAAAFARAGMVVVDNLEHLLDTATFFAKAMALPAAAEGVAILSASGGTAIMAADKAARYGVPLPQPSSRVQAILAEAVPEFGSPRNPCDATAQVANDMTALVACGEAMLSDAAYGALVYPQVSAHSIATQRLERLNEAAVRQGKLNCVVWATEWLEGPGAAEAEAMSNTTVFRSAEACFAALSARIWWQTLTLTEVRSLALAPAGACEAAIDLLRDVREDVLTEGQSMRVLAAYGVPVVSDQLVGSEEEAAAAAAQVGFPVVMKIVSPDVPHKTEAGGVKLNIRDEQGVRAAFREICDSVRNAMPKARIDGVVVQPMVGTGVELVLGARRDPLFGQLLLVGLGGIFVEVLQDVAVRLAPVSEHEAREMLRGLRGAKVLDGFRGANPVDLDRLAGVIARFSVMAAELGEEVTEIDINPLICDGGRIVAVDALVRR